MIIDYFSPKYKSFYSELRRNVIVFLIKGEVSKYINHLTGLQIN
eukprot:UN06120